jgi:hypothetical protein
MERIFAPLPVSAVDDFGDGLGTEVAFGVVDGDGVGGAISGGLMPLFDQELSCIERPPGPEIRAWSCGFSLCST